MGQRHNPGAGETAILAEREFDALLLVVDQPGWAAARKTVV